MGRPEDFFDELRAKTSEEPSRPFERTFWKKFEAEFGEKKHAVRNWNWRPHLRWAVPAFAAVLCLVLVLPRWRTAPDGSILAESEAVQTILDNSSMFEELDLFLGSRPLAELSDDEWKKLLGES